MLSTIGEVFGGINVETPSFKLLRKSAEYEIRRYAPLVMIRTPNKLNSSSGFMKLAGFIFGQNQDASVAPVKPIAMTAPVVSSNDEMWFFLPKEYDTLEKVPKPLKESNVSVALQPEQDVAILTYRGDGRSQFLAKLKDLKEALNRDGIPVDESSAVLNQFNPPWTIPFLRTNEVGLRLVKPFESSKI